MAVPHFWEGLAELGGKPFLDSLDFVGHNFYVDVFEEPLHLDEIGASVERILRNLRESNLIKAGIPVSIPIRVTENGWPTGQNPFYAERKNVRATSECPRNGDQNDQTSSA